MERLKGSISDELAKRIGASQTLDLHPTCAALACHVNNCAFFPHLLEQLVNPRIATSSKDENTARGLKDSGNTAYGESDHQKALSCYTKALRYSPWGPEATQKNAVATVLVNRANSLHKLHMLDAAVRDCTRAIELFPSYAKAWYRRGLIRSDQEKYQDANADMKEALVHESTAGGRKQIEKQLELVRAHLATSTTDEIRGVDLNMHSDAEEIGAWAPTLAARAWTSDKGAGLQTTEDLATGSLVLCEQPYAAVVSKTHRDTHCHFCFQKLPVDVVACTGCTIAVYCSDTCRAIAAGRSFSVWKNFNSGGQNRDETHNGGRNYMLPNSHRSVDKSFKLSIPKTGRPALNWEHEHECGGASWSAVLPTEAVLAARAYMRSVSLDWTSGTPATCTRGWLWSTDLYGEWQVENLCHHYDDLAPSDKLDMLVLAVVLAHCLQHSPGMKKEYSIEHISVQLVLMMARVRVNVMAIHEATSASSSNGTDENAADANCLHTLNQISAAHAIYLKGSMLNHSCDPNVHAFFSSRQLFVNSIKKISAFTALELCYGAQVGEFDRSARQKWLKERYFFTCACQACSTTKFSDLVINALRCPRPDCKGMIIGLDLLRSDSQSRCLDCLSLVDTTKYHMAAEENLRLLERIEEDLASEASGDGASVQLTKAVRCLGMLKLLVHPCNKQLAKAQDMVAKIHCTVSKPKAAIPYCEASIKILEVLYSEEHIAVANERLKLASIAMAAGETECAKNQLAQIQNILSVHYGPDYTTRFPVVLKMCQQLEHRTAY